jgi:chloramphenicol-sensitive protein RarD
VRDEPCAEVAAGLPAGDEGEAIVIGARNAAGAGDDMRGIVLAAGAYVFWGIVPVYWRWLSNVGPFEITVHRILWCALFVAGVTIARRRTTSLLVLFRQPKLIATLMLTSVLISANWLIYIYCVSSHQLVEASLGYYIVPLLSIALGVFLLGEKMSGLRLFAVALAAVAVVVKTIEVGRAPWISLALALSFGFYGFFRKRAPVEAMDGLTIETLLLFPFTLALVLYWSATGTSAFTRHHPLTDGLLIFAGPLTAVPLAMFAAGARRIRLTTLGFLQYLSPSITLTLAVFGFGEAFTRNDGITFGCVWAALILVAAEGRFSRTRTPRSPAPVR